MASCQHAFPASGTTQRRSEVSSASFAGNSHQPARGVVVWAAVESAENLNLGKATFPKERSQLRSRKYPVGHQPLVAPVVFEHYPPVFHPGPIVGDLAFLEAEHAILLLLSPVSNNRN